MPPRRRGVGLLPAQLTERRRREPPPAARAAVAPAMHFVNDMDRMSLEFTARSGGHEPFRYSVGPDEVLFYVFGDGYATSDRGAAIEHLRTLLYEVRGGRKLWW